MPRPPRILVVAQTSRLSNLLVAWLHAAPYELVVVSQFGAARVHVDLEPDLLITEVRLREHNGLHLALRARSKAVPAVVIGDPDPVLERDAADLDANYVCTGALHREEFMNLIARIITARTEVSHRSRLGWLEDSAVGFAADSHPPATATTCLDRPGVRPVLH